MVKLSTKQHIDIINRTVSTINNRKPSYIEARDYYSSDQVLEAERIQENLINEGVLPARPISHLQQGVEEVYYDPSPSKVTIIEKPLFFPNPNILDREELKDYFGPITGNLANCYDPNNQNFLFHMRGSDVDYPFSFQAAAAGMGRFRENPYITARKELEEEAGILYPQPLFNGKAIGVLPFIKGKFPQPLFSFGFINDLSRFQVCKNLGEIAEFEDIKKLELKKTGTKPEAYHFVIPNESVEEVAGQLNDSGRFYGPIYDSTINFIQALKGSKIL